MPRRRPLQVIRFLLTATMLGAAAVPAGASDADPADDVLCYPAIGPAGTMKRFCESQTIITIEPLSNGTGAQPSSATAKLHEDARQARQPSWLAFASGGLDGADRWAGVSMVANGLGGVRQDGRFEPQAGLGLRIDGTPLPQIPALVGVEIGYRQALRGSQDAGAGIGPISGLYAELRAVWAFGDTLMAYGAAGLQQRRAQGDRRDATGWSAGAGASYALDAAWAVTIDYRFTRTPAARVTPLSGTRHVHDDASLFLGGITYRFPGL